MINKTPKKEIEELAVYLKGFANGRGDKMLHDAAGWLDKLSDRVCAGGIIGCKGGENCTSSHK